VELHINNDGTLVQVRLAAKSPYAIDFADGGVGLIVTGISHTEEDVMDLENRESKEADDEKKT
jgi:hypothetical protein